MIFLMKWNEFLLNSIKLVWKYLLIKILCHLNSLVNLIFNELGKDYKEIEKLKHMKKLNSISVNMIYKQTNLFQKQLKKIFYEIN